MVQVLCFDLADLRGYHYHSGMVFAAYARGRPNAIALGGRYDQVGKAFGRARPATGFTMDLRELAGLAPAQREPAAILAPFAPGDPALQAQIAALRARGEVVVLDLPGHESTRAELNCDRRLVQRGGKWVTQAEH
jgi:ATP phosphoribosyltransferase regulatory subunit